MAKSTTVFGEESNALISNLQLINTVIRWTGSIGLPMPPPTPEFNHGCLGGFRLTGGRKEITIYESFKN